ncbi:MAG: hypothetical protein H7210_10000, partial [Pyrinomonadaceae bacterium]|nr:hypothetical protein [Phycisphaerales bacterium]
MTAQPPVHTDSLPPPTDTPLDWPVQGKSPSVFAQQVLAWFAVLVVVVIGLLAF